MSYQQLLDAVNKFFADTSRPPTQTKQDLINLIEEIQILIDSIQENTQ